MAGAIAEVSALVCQRKCVVKECSYFCVENHLWLSLAWRMHTFALCTGTCVLRRKLRGWKTLSEIHGSVNTAMTLPGMMISVKLPVLAVLLPLGLIGREQKAPRCMHL